MRRRPICLKYAVFGKGNFLLGRSRTLKNARKVLKKKNAKMIALMKKSKRTFSGCAVKKIVERKKK